MCLLTEKYWKDGSFDPQYGSVDILPVTEDIEFDVIIAEADDVSLLQVGGGDVVLLVPPGPHLPAASDGPAGLVEAEVLVEVGGRSAEADTPEPALLDLHLPVGFVLLDRRRRPGAARSAQPQAVLDDDGLVPYVIDGMASQSLSTWLM